jgi:hypothetical protein
MVYCNRLVFSMFSASFLEKALFRPFVFKKFSASCFCLVGGAKVAMQSVPARLGRFGIINPFLLRVRGGEAKDRAGSSAGVRPVPITARASWE